jgi:hypothetical protein
MEPQIFLVLVTEDELSDAVMRRLLKAVDRPFEVHTPIIARGFGNIRRNIGRYRTACLAMPHLVLTDLDTHQCAPELIHSWKAEHLPPQLMFRVAVREVESWLMADRGALAVFLKVAEKILPRDPENESDPKLALINAARRGNRMAREMVPDPGSNLTISPLYNTHLKQFTNTHWQPLRAAENAHSLARTLERLRTFLAPGDSRLS